MDESEARRLLHLLTDEDRVLQDLLEHLNRAEVEPRPLDPVAVAELAGRLGDLLHHLGALERERMALTGDGPGTFRVALSRVPAPVARSLETTRTSLLKSRQALDAVVRRHRRRVEHVVSFSRAFAGEIQRRSTEEGYARSGSTQREAEVGRLYRIRW